MLPCFSKKKKRLGVETIDPETYSLEPFSAWFSWCWHVHQGFNPWPGSLLPLPDLLGSVRNIKNGGFKEQFTLISTQIFHTQAKTVVKEVASVIIKSLPMEESHDKTKKNPNKIYQPSNQNQTETTHKVRITKSVCGVLDLKNCSI